MIREILATHIIPKSTTVYRGFLEKKFCADIVSSYERLKKINNTGLRRDNLLNTERTDWNSHTDDVVNLVASEIVKGFGVMASYSRSEFGEIKFELTESWIAESQKDALVEPHDHGDNFYGINWSFVFYARLPEEKTSLVFFDPTHGKTSVSLSEGDFLIFPSDLFHYTDDICEGRLIYSGNFFVKLC